MTRFHSDSRTCASRASTVAIPVTDGPGWLRAAFYGSKHSGGVEGIRALAWQYVSCLHTSNGRVQITRFYYDLPILLNETIELAVQGAGGPAHRDGGWDQLAAALHSPDREFDVILCAERRRFFTRKATIGFQREQIAGQHGVPVLFADESWPQHLPPWPASQRMIEPVRIALAKEDCLTARRRRWVGDG